MRLIDADAFKQYCSEGLEEMKSLFKTDKGAELAVKVTESFLKDIDEQPTVNPKQEVCEDAVSREAVQDLISRWLSDYLLDETREALETIDYKIGDMPPVTPERPKGKWIATGVDGEFECSCCQNLWQDAEENTYDDWIHIAKFCPCCGAEMGGANETN